MSASSSNAWLTPDALALFEAAGACAVVVDDDPPRYTVRAASDAFLYACAIEREALVGAGLIEACAAAAAAGEGVDGWSRLAEAFARAAASGRAEHVAAHRFALRGVAPGARGAPAVRWNVRVTPLQPASGGAGAFAVAVHRIPDAREDADTLRGLFRMAEIGVVRLALDGRILDVSDRFCAMTGYTREQLLSMSVRDLNHPEDRLAGEADLRDYLAGRSRTYSVVKRYLHRDGHTLHVQVTAELMCDADGTPLCSIGTVADVTERHSAGAEAAVARTLFHLIFANNPAAIVMTRLGDGAVLEVNDSWLRMTGESRESIVGQSARFMWPNDVDSRRFLETVRHGIVQDWDQDFLTRDGRPFATCISAQTLTIDGEQVILSTMLDVTESKRAASELAEREALLRTLTSQSRVGMMMVTAGRRYVYANAAYSEILGLPAATSLAGQRIADVLPEVYEQQIRPRLDEAFAGHPVRYELVVSKRPGAEVARTFSVSYDPPVATAHGPCVIGVIADISDQVNARNELRTLADTLELRVAERTAQLAAARDSADAANRAKSTFLANMSHEIRTPMNAIIGLTALMSRRTTDAQQHDRLGKIEVASRHLLQIINDVLDLSKIEAGRLVLEDTVFARDALIDGALDLVRPLAAAKEIDLDVDVAALPEWLRGDPTRVTQALINLLNNAVKFTDHGRVRLRAELADAGVGERDDELLARFAVEDTGEGVPPDRVDLIFNAFEQADSSTTRRHGGTGLGLALTRQLVEHMGGAIGVESELGRGSTFWFTVRLRRATTPAPAAPGLASRAQAEVELRRRFAGRRVLVAEDNAVNQEVTVELLGAVGLHVDVAGDGAEAVERALARDYDLVLMDLQMPHMDGLTATRVLRTRLPRRLPIVAMTANAYADDRAACAAAGMDDHVAKPVERETLYRVVLQWLSEAAARVDALPAGTPAECAAGTADAPLLGALERIEGLDARAGLYNVGGNPATLRRILGRFIATYGTGLPELRRAGDAGDATAIARACHALKGAAGSVGATAVHALAANLERDALAAVAGSVLATRAVALETALVALATHVAAALSAASAPGT